MNTRENLEDLGKSWSLILDLVALTCNEIAQSKGFWDSDNKGEKIALMHSELSECLEALRHGNPKDQHCPEFSNAEIELADCVIRIFDFAFHEGFNIGSAIIAKMLFNTTREHKHGKKF